ncbi:MULTISPECIES: HAMP domain-containing sensor histidine kinase [unclassified Gordonia (in: high G+C Gram-positive bacteria)]|uniref:HAMP domain-containing sensor histidine kinase n=1 Tax=unclassified Gordonia (in: high G+C Gram-positive bacteria) TaxID=2657482 RepID=UPI001FFF18A1|nr:MULTISPECIES: HAMP domain-containing sensor histidine kinase [unclassified Gordonia (in: high G+C Gram-positive bacteria)]UQE76946.1 HAMP domain-containing histidine kinase [Gordonia sp. PP30]
MRDPLPLTRSVSLRSRVALLAAAVVALSAMLMAGATYVFVYRALYQDVDTQLTARADGMTALATTGQLAADPKRLLAGTVFSTNITIALVQPDGHAYGVGDVPFEEAERKIAASTNPPGKLNQSLRTVGNYRVLARKLSDGTTLVLAQSLDHTDAILRRLASVLFVAGGIGVVFAVVAGTVVARGGLRPVARLTEAAERVARTQDLRPMPVVGRDELARLTEAFNAMLAAVAESRDKQARLVADAGHELKTPLTSLRTNLELLIAASEPGAPPVPAADMIELRSDVVAQIEELSTLVGDLVDLAREDSHDAVFEECDLEEIIDECLVRVRRRRTDVDFEVSTQSWFVFGEVSGLSRAVLNVLDNAAKWSPPGRAVQVRLRQTGPETAELTVADAGPGIPPEDRELVFERFYRAASTRSMPGSGLGLAIVRQVVERLGGRVRAEQSEQGGALIRMTFPGLPIHTEPDPVLVPR